MTEADLAVNDMLHERLREARPGYGWLSEESEDGPARLDRERVFIVDPIDGTRSFIEGSGTWAHALAVAEAGRITSAAIYLPMRDKLYTAAEGEGAFLNGARITAANRDALDGAALLAARVTMEPRYWQGGAAPEVTRHHRPSLAYRLALVAEGRFDAMLTLRDSWEWDIAAGALILAEAGAGITDRSGQALRFNNARPLLPGVIAAGPSLLPQIAGRLAR